MYKYDKELELLREKVQPMHEATTTTYYNPYNQTVCDFEQQLNEVQEMIDLFYCCTIEDEFEKVEDCNYCWRFGDETDLDKRYSILLKEFKELERLDDKTASIRYL